MYHLKGCVKYLTKEVVTKTNFSISSVWVTQIWSTLRMSHSKALKDLTLSFLTNEIPINRFSPYKCTMTNVLAVVHAQTQNKHTCVK